MIAIAAAQENLARVRKKEILFLVRNISRALEKLILSLGSWKLALM